MSTVASSVPRPGPRPSSSREEIVQCAIRMLNRDGAEAFTFRAVARETGIAGGALIRYFKNLADLQDEVAAGIMSGLRPLDAASKLGLRDQLLRLGMDLLEINRAHPYLLKIHGPASAAVVGRHTRQCMEVMMEAGIDLDRAIAIYSMVGNLAYAWSVVHRQQDSPELQASIGHAYTRQLGELAPQFEKLASTSASAAAAVYRRWLLLYIDALLLSPPPARSKKGRAPAPRRKTAVNQ